MTDPKKPRDLDDLIGEAFAERGELPPITEAEVERAEAAGIEHAGDLPDSLLEYRGVPPKSTRVVSLDEARRSRSRSFATHAAAVAIGAVAAAFVLSLRERPDPIGGAVPSVEPSVAQRDAPETPASSVAIGPVRQCPSECCAGASCPRAKPELTSCPSGRACIGCTIEQLGAERYRLRLSSFAPADAARKLLESRRAPPLELCVQVGSSKLECVPAHAADASEPWAALPLTVSAQDLVNGFLFQVRAPGAPKPLAEWRNAVRLDPTLLCKGLFIRAKTDRDEHFGSISVFLQDTYFVELARSDNLIELEEHADRLSFSDVSPTVFQTTQSGRKRFALAVGPLAKSAAERLQAELLRKNESATLGTGDDHTGAPMPRRTR